MKKREADKTNPPDQSLRKNSGPKHKVQTAVQVLTENFSRTQDLTTIQIQFTILYDDLDLDRGAEPFREIVSALLRNVKLEDPAPRALWLVSNPTELKHVLREMRKRDRGLYDNLNAHASVALVNGTSEYLEFLSDTVALGADPDRRQTLTAFPAGEGYSYFAHFKPSVEDGWENGPLCMAVDDIPGKLNDLLEVLHEAHDERISGGGKAQITNLKKSGISLVSLDTLIK